MSEYRKARERLDRLLRIGAAVNAEIEQAAQDVLEAARARAGARADAVGTGPVTAYSGDDFERYIERAWKQARNDAAKTHARDALADGERYGVIPSAAAAELRRRLGM